MSPAAQNVLDRLDATRQRWWLFTLLSTATLAVSASLGLLMAFMLGDALVRFGQGMLLAMFLAWLAVSGAMAVLLCRRLGRGQRSLEATARRVEAELPELGSNLINLVQLSEDGQIADPAFREAAVHQAATGVASVTFDQAALRESRWRRFLFSMQTPRDLAESAGLLGVLILLGVVCHLLLPNWSSAAGRLLAPWTFIPSVGSVEILEVAPGDADVLVGASVEIAATIRNPQGKAHEAVAWIIPPDGATSEVLMTADKTNTRYTLAVPSVSEPFDYRLEIGDSQTRVYSIGVRRKPTVKQVEIAYQFAAYLGRSEETVVQDQADIEAPQYTLAALRIHASAPIARGWIELGKSRFLGTVEDDGDVLVVKDLPILSDGTFTIHLENDAGHGDPDPRVNRIRAIPDAAPSVELVKPSRQSSAAAGGEVPVVIRARDDHAVGRVRLEMKVQPSEGDADAASDDEEPSTEPPARVAEWNDLPTGPTALVRHALALDAQQAPPGATVLVRAVAWDRRRIDMGRSGLRLEPQEAASPWHAVRIVAPQDEAEAALARLDNVRTAIYKILLAQIRAQSDAAKIARTNRPDAAALLAERVRTQQVDLRQATVAVVKSLAAAESDEERTIRQVLSGLAEGDMVEAVRQCDALVRVRDPAGFAAPAGQLGTTQEAIVQTLRKLLAAARRAEAELLAEMGKRLGGDLPDDTKKKLDDARGKLDEFLKQQKKVIEATENLAKKPVEDFTEEEKQLLAQLAASEDDWSRFMKELHSDLSKLPEQDFANASMLSELVEVQTELKMVEDALTKKTVDIAVPLEQLAYEMAEELLTNMEKWLPDTADRERWSQEESLSDADKEAPMAELPGELEDLIGELAEEEEDLFDEMEDISSSAADSLDKGAGWDAMDGPISNMSAKGVTGNRLPNTNELGGRGGEGRSAKSSGEFVGDEAVGKGGRKTPSRLTPDPFEKGQVKDHSKDPVGGATGGGKESGQGGQGLEGPQRRQPGPREMQRLAGRQAALRNKAEGVDLQFSVMNYHRTDLKKMIDLMAQVERDLAAGRYQNALRQRKVLLEGLGQIKQYAEGEFEVRRDATVNLPGEIQKEILGGMQDPSPPGWEELNRQYYERLSNEQR
ncbi:MAG: hypothetical protein JW809_04170 [Pirellulales bacterium]|nr:hypothetical protein [Pirellulales bacterium]